MYTKVERCRICGNPNLVRVLELGEQALTGVFPPNADTPVTVGPLNLVKCMVAGPDQCGLLQLEHSYSLGEMYGENYGYRSGLNASMVRHLAAKVDRVRGLVELRRGDLVIDIGANDGTTLGHYPDDLGLDLVGVDPTGAKFRQHYKPHVQLIPDFFSADLVEAKFPGRAARVVTSFSMFYDLEAPMAFMEQVYRILADDGVWVFEQSYMPLMLATNSYDTVCHEHLEFYALRQIQWMADRVGLRILDVEMNDVNGGSFSVTVAKGGGEPAPAVARLLEEERAAGLDTLEPYRAFAERVAASRTRLLGFIDSARSRGERVGALGASTKGNVLLQYCGLGADRIEGVGEVNPDKFGKLTPGSLIPILPEAELLADGGPDYLMVLPWHFRRFFEGAPAFRGRKLLFPLPELEVVTP